MLPERMYTVFDADRFTALRSKPDDANDDIISKLHDGDTVQVDYDESTSGHTFWKVTIPSLGLSGFVNRAYLH